MKKLARNEFRAKLFNKLMGFGVWLQNMPARITPPPFRLMQIGSAFWQSRALHVATRLGLADEIGDGEKSVREISKALNLHEDHLYRLMRMLAAIGIFRETAPRIFRNSKASEYLRSENPKNVRAMILMHNSPEMTRPWTESLEDCIRSGGIPFERSNGMDLFEYMNQHKEFDMLFSQAMDSVENLTGNVYLEDFHWGAFDRIIDVGGSKGSKSLAILESCPRLKAVVFDRPQIIEAAKTYWKGKIADEVLTRVEFQPGDMFESIPVAQSDEDLYMFFAIFHSLSDADGRKVLENLRVAAGDRKPYILFADAVVDEMHIDATIASFDMQMLIGTKGRERTLREWKSLLESGGFKLMEVMDIRTFVKFIVARPG